MFTVEFPECNDVLKARLKWQVFDRTDMSAVVKFNRSIDELDDFVGLCFLSLEPGAGNFPYT